MTEIPPELIRKLTPRKTLEEMTLDELHERLNNTERTYQYLSNFTGADTGPVLEDLDKKIKRLRELIADKEAANA